MKLTITLDLLGHTLSLTLAGQGDPEPEDTTAPISGSYTVGAATDLSCEEPNLQAFGFGDTPSP